MTQQSERDEIELFLQGEGITEIILVRVPSDGTTRDIIEATRSRGLAPAAGVEDLLVLVEDRDEPLGPDVTFAVAGITHRSRVHVHRCRRVEVTVNLQY